MLLSNLSWTCWQGLTAAKLATVRIVLDNEFPKLRFDDSLDGKSLIDREAVSRRFPKSDTYSAKLRKPRRPMNPKRRSDLPNLHRSSDRRRFGMPS